MSTSTSIEWTDATWNPVVGCSRKSPGCMHCYAEMMASRVANAAKKKLEAGKTITLTEQAYIDVVRWKDGVAQRAWSGRLILDESKLNEPFKWRKPRRIFVDSMSDLWHESLDMDDVARIYEVMEKCPQHIFQVLTKRPERRCQWTRDWADGCDVETPPHIWEGTSIESAAHMGRLEHLRQTPAAVRFLSLEPLLGPLGKLDLDGIHWVIVGGESGPGARPIHPDWVREIRDQCQAQGVAFFFKQWGAWSPYLSDHDYRSQWMEYDGRLWATSDMPPNMAAHRILRVGKKAAGAVLDDREWREFPTPSAGRGKADVSRGAG